MRDNLALIRGVQRQLEERDIQLLLAIVPAKTRLYPEHTGSHRPSALQRSLYPRFHRAVRSAGIAAPDLLEPLQAAKNEAPMFLRTDTHWTPLGAELAARAAGGDAQAEAVLKQDPFAGHLFVFRGRRGDLVKVIWWDGQGACMFMKRLEKGRFVWPSAKEGKVALSPAQLSMLLEGIDWRAPERTWRPLAAG